MKIAKSLNVYHQNHQDILPPARCAPRAVGIAHAIVVFSTTHERHRRRQVIPPIKYAARILPPYPHARRTQLVGSCVLPLARQLLKNHFQNTSQLISD